MKFLILWAIVMVADFMFMFRFEFLWPFWLLLRSVHDSFKYKGLVSDPPSIHPSIPSKTILIITNYIAGLLRAIRMHSDNVGSGLFVLHTRSLAALRGQHVCLGAVCLAHRCVILTRILITILSTFSVNFSCRQRHLSAHHNSLDAIRLSGGGHSMEGQSPYAAFRSLPAVRGALVRLINYMDGRTIS